HIDWKSTAKRRALTVRQFDDTRRTEIALGLATDTASYGGWQDFELAVSVFASVGVRALGEGLKLGAFADRVLSCHTSSALLDGCCSLERSAIGSDIPRVARSLARAAPGATLIVLVAGGGASRAMMRAAAVSLPAGARVLAVHTVHGAASGVSSTGNLVHLTVGSLRDLARVAAAAASIAR
ncbi:MAG: DUF58 domain-containing protein, partial [Bifidobacteriaceae bacterium]|nr:DUF58 domain-containing protein [Bifidobacteriaceae bacterium]